MGEEFLHGKLTERIIAAVFRVHHVLGEGFAEKVYETALAIELEKANLAVERQKPITVYYDGQVVGKYLADLVVNESVILEVKAIRAFDKAHEAQLINYLRATSVEVRLLINFSRKAEVKRFLFTNDRKNGVVA